MDEWKESYRGVFGWSVSDDGRCVPPAQHFPAFVIERLKWAERWAADGLTFQGAFDAILANNEDVMKKEFELCGDWLPTTEEFREWRDAPAISRTRQMQIAVAMLYGYEDSQGATDDDE